MSPPEIFDPAVRNLRFQRAARATPEDRWLVDRMAEELSIRLTPVKRGFSDVLLIGQGLDMLAASPLLAGATITRFDAHAPDGLQEDRTNFGLACYDLVIACGTLDSVNDLPGALILLRRALRLGGLFLGSMVGAGSLPALRSPMSAADRNEAAAVARFHPLVDVRAAGDLLGRAGFTLHVADTDTVTVNYRGFDRLIGDLRAAAVTNMLATRRAVTRTSYAAIKDGFAAIVERDGRFTESFALLFLTGWAPEASHAKPF
jgi:hypothetical protein